MVQVDVIPAFMLIHVKLQPSVGGLDVLRSLDDVRKIGVQRHLLVLFVEAELIPFDLDGFIDSMAVSGVTLSTDELPLVFHSIEDVHHPIAIVEGDDDVVVVLALARAQPLRGEGDLGAQIGAGCVVEFVGEEAFCLLDDNGVLGGESAVEFLDGGGDEAAQLHGEELSDHGASDHCRGSDGGDCGEVFIVFGGFHGFVYGDPWSGGNWVWEEETGEFLLVVVSFPMAGWKLLADWLLNEFRFVAL